MLAWGYHCLSFFSPHLCRIIEPLASRCAKFRFKPLSEEVMSKRILHISNEEGLSLDGEVSSLLPSIRNCGLK